MGSAYPNLGDLRVIRGGAVFATSVRTGPPILLPKREHQILAETPSGSGVSPREALARDARELRNKTNAPKLLELVQ